jgi:hypothetical protein
LECRVLQLPTTIEGVAITREGETIHITRAGFGLRTLLNFVASLVPLGVAVGLTVSGMGALGGLIALFFAGIAYWQLALLVDRRTVRVGRTIDASFAPLPIPGIASMALGELRDVRHVIRRHPFAPNRHSIWLRAQRRAVVAIAGLSSEEHARAIANLLSAHIASLRAPAPGPAPAPSAPASSVPIGDAFATLARTLDIDGAPVQRVIASFDPRRGASLAWIWLPHTEDGAPGAGSSIVGLTLPWTSAADAAFPQIAKQWLLSRSFTVLRARSIGRVALRTVHGKPDLIDGSFAIDGAIDPAATMTSLVGKTIVKASASSAVAAAWSALGIACDRLEVEEPPPVGPTVYRFSGAIAPDRVVAASTAMARHFGRPEVHRSLVELVARSRSTRAELDVGYDSMLSVLWLAAIDLTHDEAHALLSAALSDEARASRVLRALASVGVTRCSITLSIGSGTPVRARVEGALA